MTATVLRKYHKVTRFSQEVVVFRGATVNRTDQLGMSPIFARNNSLIQAETFQDQKIECLNLSRANAHFFGTDNCAYGVASIVLHRAKARAEHWPG